MAKKGAGPLVDVLVDDEAAHVVDGSLQPILDVAVVEGVQPDGEERLTGCRSPRLAHLNPQVLGAQRSWNAWNIMDGSIYMEHETVKKEAKWNGPSTVSWWCSASSKESETRLWCATCTLYGSTCGRTNERTKTR